MMRKLFLFGLIMAGMLALVGCDKAMPEKEQDEIVQQEDGEGWWNMSFCEIMFTDRTPPEWHSLAKKWPDEEEPFPVFSVSLEKPKQGSMSDVKYRALLDFVGGAIIKGAESDPVGFVGGSVTNGSVTVESAVESVRTWFWGNHDSPSKWVENIFYLEIWDEIKYSDKQYFSYAVKYGGLDWGVVTAAVWSWEKMRELKITDFIDINKHKKALKKLMRKAVYEEFKEAYADNMETVLPKYAKNWPETFENFYVCAEGIRWCFASGEVLIGGRCPMEIVVGWDKLKGLLLDEALIPRKK